MLESWRWWLMSFCSFTINLNKKQSPIYCIFNEIVEGNFSRASSLETILELESFMWLKLYLIGKSRIWFYCYFGQCMLKVVTINNSGLGKGPWIFFCATTIRYQQWSKDSLFSYTEREFFNEFSILRATMKPLRIPKKNYQIAALHHIVVY